MGPVGADDDHPPHEADHKVARAALARGEVLPLEKILNLVRPKVQHEIVGIKFVLVIRNFFARDANVIAHFRLLPFISPFLRV